jgi:RNA polymerase sigma factor (sigma-70 family)
MNDLIEQNMGLVISIVNSFGPKNHTERDDLIDAGRIGLWKALEKYSPDNGNSISTYAWRPIKWSIIKEIKNRRSFVSIDNIVDPEIKTKNEAWEYYTNDITEEEKMLIELRKEGYRFHEICDILKDFGKPSKIKKTYYKLIKKLREANA